MREESLSDITAVEMIDLPISAQEATVQEEFGQSDGEIGTLKFSLRVNMRRCIFCSKNPIAVVAYFLAGVLELFVNRIRSQIHQISVRSSELAIK